jgi:hypothetical protein
VRRPDALRRPFQRREGVSYPQQNDVMEDFWNEQAAWSRSTFGADTERGPIGPVKHLLKEVRDEALPLAEAFRMDAPASETTTDLHGELVDCLFLTFDAARRAGMTYHEMLEGAFRKLAINKARTWPKPTSSTEPVEHDRSGENA